MKTSFEFMNHLCIVFELLSIDIYTLLTQIEFQGLPLALIKNYSKQILKCLDYLDSLHIIHCDLKPENILLKSLDDWSNIKIIDFGSSCFDNERVFTYLIPILFFSFLFLFPNIILFIGFYLYSKSILSCP